MSSPFLSNLSFSPVPFSFRQGGKEGKWGIWCTFDEDSGLLGDPRCLCETLDENGLFSNFFIPEEPGSPESLPVEDIHIEDPPCVAETYIWEIPLEGHTGIALHFVEDEYILAVLTALQALYRHSVMEGKETAYIRDHSSFARYLLHAREASSDYLFDKKRMRKFQKLLRLPLEPFHAEMGPGLRMTMGVGDREKTFMLADTDPDAFRHEMEHLVFHDETSLFLSDPPVLHKESGLFLDGDTHEIVFKRVTGVPILFIYLRSPYYLEEKTFGFCREKEALSALAAVFRERYPKQSLGHALNRYLRELR